MAMNDSEKLDVIKEIIPEGFKNEKFASWISELENSKATSNKNLKIKIIVASELSDEQLKGIIKKIKDMYKVETVQYTIEIDESIIGGIKVCVGNTIYDNTIETRLRQMF